MKFKKTAKIPNGKKKNTKQNKNNGEPEATLLSSVGVVKQSLEISNETQAAHTLATPTPSRPSMPTPLNERANKQTAEKPHK